jgi:hypothetical protein
MDIQAKKKRQAFMMLDCLGFLGFRDENLMQVVGGIFSRGRCRVYGLGFRV